MPRSTNATSLSARDPPPLVTSSMTGFQRAPQSFRHHGAGGLLEDEPLLAVSRELASAPAASATSRPSTRRSEIPFRLVGEHHRLQEEEQLQLLLGQPADGRHQYRDVSVDLPLDDRRRMPLRGLEVTAVFGALDFHQALGGAAHRANVVAQGGAGAFCRPFLTKRANHMLNTIRSTGRNSQSAGGVCNCPV